MNPPLLTFFCELKPQDLIALFDTPELIPQLRHLKAGVSLGILDFSPERAAVAKRLNAEGIPVSAWLLLPVEEGYWFNLDNYEAAQRRYRDFQIWTAENQITWHHIGLDIEPDLRWLQTLARDRAGGIRQLVQGVVNRREVARKTAQYQQLVDQIRADGYFVESYQLPNIVDERQMGSRLLARLIGITDLAVDREVLMLYSSFEPGFSPGRLLSYAPDAQAIGVGSTGGGVEMKEGQTMPAFGWNELRRDLLLSARYTDWVYIFSLEGCVRQNILPRMLEMDWSADPFIDPGEMLPAAVTRRAVRGVLWASAHPTWVAAGLAALIWLGKTLSRRR